MLDVENRNAKQREFWLYHFSNSSCKGVNFTTIWIVQQFIRPLW